MKDRENDNNFVEEDNKQFVIADNVNPRLQRARELMIRAVARQRIAMWAQIKALEAEGVGLEVPASELWREMPELAREHEASRGDDGLRAEDVLVADDWESDEFGGVTA